MGWWGSLRDLSKNILNRGWVKAKVVRRGREILIIHYVLFMYQLIPSLTIPPGDPLGFARYHCPGVGFSPNFLCLGGRGSE